MKCETNDCKKKAVFHLNCSLCNKCYCLNHRLPEEHNCINLETINKINKSKNTQQLLENKTDCEKLENKI